MPLILFITSGLAAQQLDGSREYRKFPLITGAQFQNFAMPFRDMGSNFRHPGFFAGSEIPWNKKKTLFQNGIIGAYRNREMGNGVYIHSQFSYRPRLSEKVFGEVKAGVGYLYVFHPVQAYRFEDGRWKEVNGGKSQLTLPVEIAVGYTFTSPAGLFSPFISWQVSPALFYNKTLPLNIYTNFLVGIRTHLVKRPS